MFIFPSAVVHELESLFRDFLWAQGGNSKARCRIAWSSVCEPKDCGGLGFSDFQRGILLLLLNMCGTLLLVEILFGLIGQGSSTCHQQTFG